MFNKSSFIPSPGIVEKSLSSTRLPFLIQDTISPNYYEPNQRFLQKTIPSFTQNKHNRLTSTELVQLQNSDKLDPGRYRTRSSLRDTKITILRKDKDSYLDHLQPLTPDNSKVNSTQGIINLKNKGKIQRTMMTSDRFSQAYGRMFLGRTM
eukprot:EST47312.1 Hypothetical protein SS50377_12630 [Spironucleus salmonicida]